MNNRKRTIVVVECISSSANYIKDIIDEGYDPVLLELGCPEEDYAAYRANHDLAVQELFTNEYPELPVPKTVQAGVTYEETLATIRALRPVIVIPGGDDGIEAAMRLSSDLGLVSNDPADFEIMRNKYETQQALKRAGLRYIRSKIVHSRSEADQVFQELGGIQVVLKPVSGAASVGVHVCVSPEEFKAQLDRYSDDELRENGVLMEERIVGTEYICNTVSCQGHHKVTGMMRYNKVLVAGQANRYDTDTTIDPHSKVATSIVEYALAVLDAIGLQFGPVHGEFMVDEMGPVLIEVNCRLCGGAKRAKWLDRIFGNHESDVSLQAYLHPEDFLADGRTILMDGEEFGIVKFLAIDKDIFVKKSLIDVALKDLPGFMYANKMGDGRLYQKTINLATASGIVLLADKDPDVVRQSIAEIDDMQKNHPERLYDFA